MKKVKVSVVQSCLTICDPMDCSLPGFFVHGILQARVIERVATLFSSDLPDPGQEPGSPALQADSLLSNLVKKMGSHVTTEAPLYLGVCNLKSESESEVTQSCPTVCDPWTVAH